MVILGCVLFLGGFAWGVLEYRPYSVPTQSMTPTVDAGDRVLAQRIDGSRVHRGDVVVFQDPTWGDVPEVKRVIGVGGDHIVCCTRGRLTVNGTAISEPYLKGHGPASLTPFKATVPAGDLFLMGDNRAVSEDSRLRLTDADDGSVPRSDVQARVDGRVWPLGRFGAVPRTRAFAALPGGVSGRGPLRWIGWSVVAGAVLIMWGAAYGQLAAVVTRRRGRAGG
jgi:signal peptidase I